MYKRQVVAPTLFGNPRSIDPTPAAAATQKSVVLLINGVAKEAPVPNGNPPVELAYQFMSLLLVADKFTVPGPHFEPGVVERIVGESTIMVTTFDESTETSQLATTL